MDGTGTQVATCMINRWTAKISGRRIDNMRDLLEEGEIEKQREKEEGRRLQFLGLPKTLTAKHQRTEKKKN